MDFQRQRLLLLFGKGRRRTYRIGAGIPPNAHRGSSQRTVGGVVSGRRSCCSEPTHAIASRRIAGTSIGTTNSFVSHPWLDAGRSISSVVIVAISSSRRLRPIGVFAVHAGIGSILIALKGIHTLAVIMIVVLVSTGRGSHGGCGRDPTAVAARHDGVCCLSLSMFSVYLLYLFIPTLHFQHCCHAHLPSVLDRVVCALARLRLR